MQGRRRVWLAKIPNLRGVPPFRVRGTGPRLTERREARCTVLQKKSKRKHRKHDRSEEKEDEEERRRRKERKRSKATEDEGEEGEIN